MKTNGNRFTPISHLIEETDNSSIKIIQKEKVQRSTKTCSPKEATKTITEKKTRSQLVEQIPKKVLTVMNVEWNSYLEEKKKEFSW
jgi:hypothetical protein